MFSSANNTFGHVLAGIGMLIFAGLVLKNWQGANSLLGTSLTGGTKVISTLQHP